MSITIEAPPDDVTLSYMVTAAVKAFDERRPRMQQKSEGLLGPSDIGFCHQKALLTMRQTPSSDPKNDWAAFCGTAVGREVELALKAMYPDWLVGAVDGIRTTAHVHGARGQVYEVSGTPDVIVPRWNALYDIKTKDGLVWFKRRPWETNYRYQTWLYVQGLIEAGVLDPEHPIPIGLLGVDRSGKTPEIAPATGLWDPLLAYEIGEWIDDVVYAFTHNEDAYRDIPAPVCEQICEFFTVCRGDLPMSDGDLIDDPMLVELVAAYAEARDNETHWKNVKKETGEQLHGVNGVTTGGLTIRWTHVEESKIDYLRQGYDKIDVRKSRQR